MNTTSYFAQWAGLYILSAGLGFIPEPAGALMVIIRLVSFGFFVPGFLLVHHAKQKKDKNTLKLVRNLCLASLILTVTVLMANLLSFSASEAVGNVLYAVLLMVSAPMAGCGVWLASLFLWAWLLMVTLQALKERKK